MAKELGREQEGQGFGAAALLSFIYIMTQSAGFLFAYQHAFLGDGEKAHELTRDETHYETYVRAIASPYLNRAESRLAELRQYLGERIPDYAKNPSRASFMDFYKQRQTEKLRQEDMAGLIQQPSSRPSLSTAKPTTATPSATPLTPTTTTRESTSAGREIGATDEELRTMAQEIYNLSDAAARKARFQERSARLGSAEQMKLLDYFNQIKDDHARVQTLADDLFKD